MEGLDRGVALRAGALQVVLVAVVAVALALALPTSFFADRGWLAGPAAWLGCALVMGRVLRLPLPAVVIGAVLAGLPSVVFVALGAHWAGAVVGVVLLGLWCGRLARDRALEARTL